MARTLSELLRKPPRKRKLLVRHTLTTTTLPGNDDDDGDDDDEFKGRKKKSELQRWMEPSYKKSKKDDMVVIDDSSDDDEEDLMAAARAMPWRLFAGTATKKTTATATATTATDTPGHKDLSASASALDPSKPSHEGDAAGVAAANGAAGKDEVMELEMNSTPDGKCRGTNRRGERCGRKPRVGNLFCNKHAQKTPGGTTEPPEEEEETTPPSPPPPPERVYTQCWGISKRGSRCCISPKEGKFCMYHNGVRIYGEIDKEDDAGVGAGSIHEEPSKVATRLRDEPDKKIVRGLCRALCRDGYQCARLSTLGHQFCTNHNETRVGEVVSGSADETGAEEELELEVEEEEEEWGEEAGEEAEEETMRYYSSGAEQCRAKNIRNERCGKPAYGDSAYCYAHLEPNRRSGTIDDSFASTGKCRAISGRTNKRCGLVSAADHDYCFTHLDPNRRSGTIDDGVEVTTNSHPLVSNDNRRLCGAVCSRNDRHCTKSALEDGLYCFAHLDSSRRGKKIVTETDLRCRAISIRTGQRCAKPPNPDSLYCFAHEDPDKRTRTIDDTESEEEEDEEDEEYDEKRTSRPRERDFIFRGDPETTQCIALSNRRRVCCNKAVGGKKFCNLHTAIRPRYTRDSGMATTEGLSSKLRFFRGEPGSSQCDAFNNSGQLCPYVADDDSVHCRFHKGSDRARYKIYSKEPGTHPCDSYSNLEDGKPCPYEADDNSTHCPLHKGTDNYLKMPATAVASKPPSSVEADDVPVDPVLPETVKSPPAAAAKDTFQNVPRTKSGRDVVFKSSTHKGQKRCGAVTHRGYTCIYVTVDGTPYCYRHESLNENPSTSPASDKAGLKDDDLDKTFMGKDDDDSSLDSCDGEGESNAAIVQRPFSYREFLKMWRECEEFCGEETDEIESTRRVRGANHRMSPDDTDGQAKAQYGRLLPRAMKVGSDL
jgi:hypothetical protein